MAKIPQFGEVLPGGRSPASRDSILAPHLSYLLHRCQGCLCKKSTSSKLYSNCCYMLGYLSLRYRYSGSKFRFLLWVEIDRNIFEIRHYELHLQVAFIVCHKTRVKPLYICKLSPKSIGSSIGEVGFLLLYHLYTILGSKTGFRFKKPNGWQPKLPQTTVVVNHRQRSHIQSFVKFEDC